MIDWDRINSIISDALAKYEGDVTIFESAVGCLFLGMLIGWNPLRIIHNPRTIKRYEKILSCSFVEVLPLKTDLAFMSLGYSNFLLSGDTLGRAAGGIISISDRKIFISK
jgi:hypothetical protein